jgi:hypothetical protein
MKLPSLAILWRKLKKQQSLFDYCRYVRSNALDDFQSNYLHELLSLQINKEVAAYVESLPVV